MPLKLLHIVIFLLSFLSISAQNVIQEVDESRAEFLSDSVVTENVPEGIYAWNIDRRFGVVKQVPFDTVPHLFPREALTDGKTSRYNFTGNLGAPRVSRIFIDEAPTSFNGQFIFKSPFSYFLKDTEDILFTNTKSPFTNITYHECGNKQHGEDHITANFAVNAGKKTGFGFRLDYLYGRGYYDAQATSMFNGMVFGSHISERYKLHIYYSANHLKIAENGGIENDAYETTPESFPTSYSEADMPTSLNKTWNKLNVNTFYLTHSYNIGYTRFLDKKGNVVRLESNRLASKFYQADSLATNGTKGADSLSVTLTPQFVPVTQLTHTFRVDHHNRRFLSNASKTIGENYFQEYFWTGDSANDYTKYLRVENTLAIELREGLNKWMKAGIRLFAKHEFQRFTLPDLQEGRLYDKGYTENYIYLGAQIIKTTGRTFRYNLLGELRTTGKRWGEFNIEGQATLQVPFLKDSLRLSLQGYVRNERPSFYYHHYHARNAWWDTDLDNQFRARISFDASWRDTHLQLFLENIQKYTYFQEHLSPYTTDEGLQRYRAAVSVAQKKGNLQLFGATLRQNFHWGIFHWDNELTLQATTDSEAFPLPLFSAWTNVYLKFRIAKVLNTEFGADMTFFTKYYAPAYSPTIAQFASQDTSERIKLGAYPIINAYLNFHLKRTRFYLMLTHLNYSHGSGKPFLVPHYPLNRLIIRLGISWNFIN